MCLLSQVRTSDVADPLKDIVSGGRPKTSRGRASKQAAMLTEAQRKEITALIARVVASTKGTGDLVKEFSLSLQQKHKEETDQLKQVSNNNVDV